MKVVQAADLQPEMTVGKSLVDGEGVILLKRGVRLTADYIDTIQTRGYARLYIMEEELPFVDFEEDLPLEIRAKAAETLYKTYDAIGATLSEYEDATYSDIMDSVTSKKLRPLRHGSPALEHLPELVSSLIENVLTRNTLAGVASLKAKDSRLYEHSLDVCVIALMIGKALNLPENSMRQLAAGCLLHDAGKLLTEPSEDSNVRIIQHTTLGYELLRSDDDFDTVVAHVAYEHHEHQFGSGLPRGLMGSNILERKRSDSGPVLTLLGEIAAVANVYENLLSGQQAAMPMAPDAALREVTGLAGICLNREVVQAFRTVAPVYPRGTRVRVKGGSYDGQMGTVKEVNPGRLDRPKLQLTHDGGGDAFEGPIIDLTEFPRVTLDVLFP